VQIPSPSRDRRNAQPLRCSLASLPLSQALPVFHSSSSSSVAHSSSIKPAPLVRLLLDIPEVKHLHSSVTSHNKLSVPTALAFRHSTLLSPPIQPQLPRLLAAGLYPYLAASCTRLFPDSYDYSYTPRNKPFTGPPLSSNVGNFVLESCHHTRKSPCLLSEAPQRPSRSRPSDLTKRTRRGTRTRYISSVFIDTNCLQSLHCSISP
jgi:hypothetical protein